MLLSLKNQKGSIAVLSALVITAMLGFASLVVDIGNLYLNRIQLENLADAAALAGAQELPVSSQQATVVARDYASRNGYPSDRVIVNIDNSNTVVQVTVQRTVTLFFAQVFNLASSDVSTSAKAATRVITGVSGVVPLGVEKQNFVYGQTYTLKEGGGSGSTGNYGGLALGGNGASVYNDNLKYGYSGQLALGQWVSTEPGNMSGPTRDGINYRIGLDPTATYQTVQKNSPRIVFVPIMDSMDVNGKKPVRIVGFAAFFLEGVGGSGNNNYVTGEFLQYRTVGDTSGTASADYGLRAVSLIQ